MKNKLVAMLLVLALCILLGTALAEDGCAHHTHTQACVSNCMYACEPCAAEIQGLVNLLPDAKQITDAQKPQIIAQLEAISALNAAASDATRALVNYYKYEVAAFAMDVPENFFGFALEKRYDAAGYMPQASFTFANTNGTVATLYSANGVQMSSAEPRSNGAAEFYYLPAGTYIVHEDVAGEWDMQLSVNGTEVTGSRFTGKAGEMYNLTAVNQSASYDVEEYSSVRGTVTAEPTNAKVGETVRLTVTPALDFFLSSLSVTDGDGNEVPVNADNTFSMPASKATVSAEFQVDFEKLYVTIYCNGVDIGPTSNDPSATVGDFIEIRVFHSDKTSKFDFDKYDIEWSVDNDVFGNRAAEAKEYTATVILSDGDLPHETEVSFICKEGTPTSYYVEDGVLKIIDNMTALPNDVQYNSIEVELDAILNLPATPEVAKSVTNYGTISGGTYTADVNCISQAKINGGTFHGTVNNNGSINGGTFNAVVVNRSIITGGEFANTSTVNCTSSAKIYGGAFKGIVNNHSSSIIRDGTFEGTVDNTSSEIQGGTFNCKVENGRYGTISGGTFNDVVFNGKNTGVASTISGGEFTKDSIIINKKSGIISGGNLKGKIYYSIKIASSDNGNVVVDNVDPFNENAAMAGDIVTLTVEPDAGYMLESIVAAMPNGSAVEIDAFEDDAIIYQFTMPASVVTITATFASVANIENDTLYVSGRLTELPEGTYTKIQVDSKSELALEGVTVTQDVQNYGTISGGTYTGNVTNYEKIDGGEFHGDVSCYNGADITDGTFRGPVNNSGNSTISGGTFWNVVSNRSNSDIQNGIFHNGVENSSRGNISGGTFYGPVTNGSNAGAAATISGGTFENDVTNRKSGIIEGNPTFNRNMYYGINIYPSDNGNVVTNHVDSFDENAARAGDTVTLTVEPKEGYELATLTIIDADENPVEVRKTGLFEYQFTMPARAITAKTSFNKCILVYFDNNGPKWENVWAICYDENDVGHSVALTTDMCQDGVYTVYAPAGTVKIQFQNQPPLSPDKPLKTDIVDIQEETTYTYTQKDFVVTFDANGGKGTMAPQTFVDGQEQKLSKNLFGRSGYMFVRWNTKANGTGISYADEQVISLTENIPLYAQWAFIPVQLESYIVCFDANGGEGMMNAQMFYKGLSRNLILNRFVREGYTFDGWNTEPDGKGQYYGDGWNITVSKDMTLYAQWKQNPPRVKPEYKIAVNGSKGTITRLNDTSLIYEDMYIRYAVSYIFDGEPYMVVDLIKVKWEKTQKGVIGTFSIPNLHSSGKITNESFLLTTNDNANKVVISDVVPNSYGFLVQ